MTIKCKPYSEITVESGTQLKTVHICSVYVVHDSFLKNQIAKFVIKRSLINTLEFPKEMVDLGSLCIIDFCT